MITTRQVNVLLRKLEGKNQSVTTKDVKLPKIKILERKDRPHPVSISTHTIGDVQDIKDKHDRDAIMKERKAFEKGDAVYQDETGEFIVKKPKEKTTIEQAKDNGIEVKIETKTDEEKKLIMAERMAKVRAAKKKNKKGGKNA